MTLAAISGGLYYPRLHNFPTGVAGAVVDATGEKFAMIGRLYIDGRPAGAKTLSSSGGNIQFRAGTVTWVGASGSTLEIGIQGVASGSGPIAQPDGSFGAKAQLVAGSGLSANVWNTVSMTTGTSSLTHGDLVAIVFDMTNRGGADTVTINAANSYEQTGATTTGFPTCNAFVAGAWQTTNSAGASRLPNAIISFDDGTLGWIDHTMPSTSPGNTETFNDTTNPDERGLIFQIPWDCKIDALWAYAGITDANSDFTLKLYSDPTGTPTLVTSIAVAAENMGVAGLQGFVKGLLATEVSLTRNTSYILTVRATGSSNTRLAAFTLGNTAHRAFVSGGTTLAKGTRQNDTGAFTAESPAVTIYAMGVSISQLHDTASAGSGSYVIGG